MHQAAPARKKQPKTTTMSKAKSFGKALIKEYGKNPRKAPLSGKRKKI